MEKVQALGNVGFNRRSLVGGVSMKHDLLIFVWKLP